MISARVVSIVLGCLLLIGVGAAGGVWLGARHYRPQLDVANKEKGQCVTARDNLEELAKEQGAKLGELSNQAEQRQAKAAQAVANAQQQAGEHYAAAQRLQQERADGDPAAVAEALIDKELGL
ncbi:TPA: hypothetical protein ACU6GO_001067 [Pseudomonas aeruginosa]|uniref:Uncharacterized protein n=1 Tax=Pseudomonas phage Riah TaxID=3075860 RepID=A0AAX4B1U9_9CAUD|nr:hypothetical protein [Pseudomonas aeruginosa]WNL50616.1 hypothetical protein [Pseudomonas phage Riah]ELK4757847.1 hypothetical protein [Pseudomonas aeruginosa]EMB4855971.1 hypothetical protein [Pseudomonas aeruginosa]MBH4203689.1 hypothetical protein [Pseudomonas aeruginosa]MBH4279932.1 hypothetical protein [Pseudomonas aeruginosa]